MSSFQIRAVRWVKVIGKGRVEMEEQYLHTWHTPEAVTDRILASQDILGTYSSYVYSITLPRLTAEFYRKEDEDAFYYSETNIPFNGHLEPFDDGYNHIEALKSEIATLRVRGFTLSYEKG